MGINEIIKEAIIVQKIDPLIKVMAGYRKLKQLPVIVQSKTGIDDKIKKCINKYGGIVKEEYPFIKSCLATASYGCIRALETLYQVTYISLDYPVIAHLDTLKDTIGVSIAHNLNCTGRKITVALLDTGTYPHPDLVRPRNRILRFIDLVKGLEYCYDDNGHGTFTAGIIAGNGCMSEGKYTGIAPQASLVSLKVLNQSGNGRVSTVISGLQWIYDNKDIYKIRIVCLPLGCNSHLSWNRDPLSRAAQVLWESGLVVCASAGNNGPENGWISSPGINPSIITAGAMQTYGNTVSPSQPICSFSSRGPTRDGDYGLDVVAPGTNITSLNCETTFLPKSPAAQKVAKLPNYYRRGSGTSAACAVIAGIVALLLEKEPVLTPDEVKSLLQHSCKSFNLPKSHQGWGLPDINKLLE